jgi:hypothetical protein
MAEGFIVIFVSIGPFDKDNVAMTIVSNPAAGAVVENDFLPIPELIVLPFIDQEMRVLSRFSTKLLKLMVVFSCGAGLGGTMFTNMPVDVWAFAVIPNDTSNASVIIGNNNFNLMVLIISLTAYSFLVFS